MVHKSAMPFFDNIVHTKQVFGTRMHCTSFCRLFCERFCLVFGNRMQVSVAFSVSASAARAPSSCHSGAVSGTPALYVGPDGAIGTAHAA